MAFGQTHGRHATPIPDVSRPAIPTTSGTQPRGRGTERGFASFSLAVRANKGQLYKAHVAMKASRKEPLVTKGPMTDSQPVLSFLVKERSRCASEHLQRCSTLCDCAWPAPLWASQKPKLCSPTVPCILGFALFPPQSCAYCHMQFGLLARSLWSSLGSLRGCS